jgi:hypothetical protein
MALLLTFGQGKLAAQMPNFFGKPAEPAKPAASPTVPTTPGGESSPATTPAPASPTTGLTSDSLYNPTMDNHLKAPPPGKEIGAFGLPVSRVEDLLRANGAKNYSYAFGKYSRMVISAYIVTIYFDRARIVGGVSVEPKPPYQTIEPEARKFFMDLFLKNGDLSNFEVNISSTRFELKYKL